MPAVTDGSLGVSPFNEDSECVVSSSVSESSRETLLCDSDDEFSTDLDSSFRKEHDAAVIDLRPDLVDACLANARQGKGEGPLLSLVSRADVKFSRLFAKQRVHPHSNLPISNTVALESTAPSPSRAITAEALTIDESDEELAPGAAFRRWPGPESVVAEEYTCQAASVSGIVTSKVERRRWRACLNCNKLFNLNKVLCSGNREMRRRRGRASDADVPKGMCDECWIKCYSDSRTEDNLQQSDYGDFLSILAADDVKRPLILENVRGDFKLQDSDRAQDRSHSGCFRSMWAILLRLGETRIKLTKVTPNRSQGARGRAQRIQPALSSVVGCTWQCHGVST